MMWWAVWCAVLVAGSYGAAAAPAPDSLADLAPFDLLQIDDAAPDDEGVSYAMPAMGGRFVARSPRLLGYLLDEMPRDEQMARREIEIELYLQNSALKDKARNTEHRIWQRLQAERNQNYIEYASHVVASSDVAMRQRRDFSVNPAVDLLQRWAHNTFRERQMHNNRDILNNIGKRDFPYDRMKVGSSGRAKRRMPSLSIDLPMSVLRNKLSLEKERKMQMLRAAANRSFLNGIGKRDAKCPPLKKDEINY